MNHRKEKERVFVISFLTMIVRSNIKVEEPRQNVVKILRDVYKNIDSTDLEFVKSDFEIWRQRQEIKTAILNSVKYLENNDFDSIKLAIDSAFKSMILKDKSLDYLTDIDYRYTTESEKEKIPTGWGVIDELTSGGLPKGKFGIIMAPTGIGKTWVLCHLGAAALKRGKNVIHYTMELDDVYTAHRYDTILTGISSSELKYNIPEIKKKLSKITSGKLTIEEYPPSTLSITALEASIDKHILLGNKPDLIILDYPELMKIEYNSKTREDQTLGEFYKDLRGLFGRKDVAGWGADQTNRGGSSKDVIENDSISNSFAKLFVVDFLLTVSRRPRDKEENTARFFVSKSRLSIDGISYPAKFDTSKGIIELYDERTDDGKRTEIEMSNQHTYQKRILSSVYDKNSNLF